MNQIPPEMTSAFGGSSLAVLDWLAAMVPQGAGVLLLVTLGAVGWMVWTETRSAQARPSAERAHWRALFHM
jgi:hypothetical protein